MIIMYTIYYNKNLKIIYIYIYMYIYVYLFIDDFKCLQQNCPCFLFCLVGWRKKGTKEEAPENFILNDKRAQNSK